jgi:hypothetical protein
LKFSIPLNGLNSNLFKKFETLYLPDEYRHHLKKASNEKEVLKFGKKIKRVDKDSTFIVQPYIFGVMFYAFYHDGALEYACMRDGTMYKEELSRLLPAKIDTSEENLQLIGKCYFFNKEMSAGGSSKVTQRVINGQFDDVGYLFEYVIPTSSSFSTHSEAIKHLHKCDLSIINSYYQTSEIEEVVSWYENDYSPDLWDSLPVMGIRICVNEFDTINILQQDLRRVSWCVECKDFMWGYEGNTPAPQRDIKQQKAWSKAILSRDENKCMCCGASDKKLYAHHKKSYSTSKENEAFSIDNGITLCITCHKTFHSPEFYGTTGHTAEDTEKFIEDYRSRN